MVKHSKFPSIGQFKEIVKEVQMSSSYVGKDDNGDAIFDYTLPKPTLRFEGFVKLHGTNAGVGHSTTDGIWVQSRTNVITPTQDNAGFAFFVESKRSVFEEMFEHIRYVNANIIGKDDDIIIFGEWAGGGIQKGVAITGIEKSFFIFDVKIIPEDDSPSYYVDYDYLRQPEDRIYNISDYLSYTIDIDFNRPQLIQTKLTEITQTVEDLCPVGKAFGIDGVGEGVVWSATYNGSKLRFKVKGDKHAGASKVKVLKPVDDAKLNKIYAIVDEVTPTWRLDQMLTEACDLINGGTIDRKFLGDYIRLVINDVMKEELDTLSESGLEPKDINAHISKVARDYFFEREKDL